MAAASSDRRERRPGRARSESPRACASARCAIAGRWRSARSAPVEASSCGACRARTSAAYSLPPIIVRGTSSEPSSAGQPRVRVRAERRRAHLAVDGERDVGAGQRLERRGAVVVEQVADRERAEQFRPLEADRHRHADDLQHAVRVRPERVAGVPPRARAMPGASRARLTATGRPPSAASTWPSGSVTRNRSDPACC